MARVLMAAVLVLAVAAPGAGQVCGGGNALGGSSVGLHAGFASHAYAEELSLSAIAGRERYVGARIARVTDDEMDAVSQGLSVFVGGLVPVDRAPRFVLCPGAEAGVMAGPTDYLHAGDDFRFVDVRVGAAVGYRAVETGRISVLPFAALDGHLLRASRPDRQSEMRRRGESDVRVVMTAGFLVLVGGRVAVQPFVYRPLGLPDPYTMATPFGQERGRSTVGLTVGAGMPLR
jgi:hypothetical protein